MTTTYEIRISRTSNDDEDHDASITIDSEDEARDLIRVIKEVIKARSRLGKVCAWEWWGTDPIFLKNCQKDDAIISHLIEVCGYYSCIEEIVSFQKVTRDNLTF